MCTNIFTISEHDNRNMASALYVILYIFVKDKPLINSVTPICYWVGVLRAGGIEMGLALVSINRVSVKVYAYVLY